ncbi:hypothetical protein TNCT_655391 [Trichonephila clavata]|uniref:Uncharacterized protein n=1 Tax=Trichonephila clavata TaxID=2740835 RepID=A0A8X6FR67_TRICU|nr:hypothetical protein TNCT_655391 [Trichonephila clavata]
MQCCHTCGTGAVSRKGVYFQFKHFRKGKETINDELRFPVDLNKCDYRQCRTGATDAVTKSPTISTTDIGGIRNYLG